MRKIFVAAAAATLVVAAATPASAGKSKQKMTCGTNKAGVFNMNQNTGHLAGTQLFRFTNTLTGIKLSYTAVQQGGFGANKTFLIDVEGIDDPRSTSLPKTYKNSEALPTVVGLFNNTTVKRTGRTTFKFKTTSWSVPAGASSNKFAITVKSFNQLTSQARGTFGGKMEPGDSNPNAGILKVNGGTFVADCSFIGF